MARPRNIETDEIVLAAAAAALTAGGYDELVVDQLARSVGVAKTTVYRRWPTKDHLVLAVLDRLVPAIPADASITDITARLERSLADPRIRRIVAELVAAASRDETLAAPFGEFWSARRDALAAASGDHDADAAIGALFFRALIAP